MCPALVVHVAHVGHGWGGAWGLGDVGDERLRGEDHGGDGGGVLEGAAGDLYGVDDAALDHVAVDVVHGVVAELRVVALAHGVDDDGAFDAGVLGDLDEGLFEDALEELDAGTHVTFEGRGQGVEDGLTADEADATAGDDAFLDGAAGGGQGVLYAQLLLLALDLGGGADFEDGDTAGELGQALLELLAVEV